MQFEELRRPYSCMSQMSLDMSNLGPTSCCAGGEVKARRMEPSLVSVIWSVDLISELVERVNAAKFRIGER